VPKLDAALASITELAAAIPLAHRSVADLHADAAAALQEAARLDADSDLLEGMAQAQGQGRASAASAAAAGAGGASGAAT
jgi:hypothetical protein